MKITQNRQAGFHVIEFSVLVIVLAVMGFVGFKVWQNSSSSTSGSTASSSTQTAPQIAKTKDLTTAATAVDQINVGTNTSELTSIETDLNSL